MKTLIAITDLTRMHQGRICISGYNKEGQCIRPVLPHPGIKESLAVKDGKAVLHPFAVVEFDLLDPTPKPPHSEDVPFDPTNFTYVRLAKDRERLLKLSLFKNVESIFEQPIQKDGGYCIADGVGPRSVGTILPHNIHQVIYAPEKEGEAWDYRIGFYDWKDTYYRLKITDLTWHIYCARLQREGKDHQAIAEQLTQMVKKRKTYLRIGLSRGWKLHPDKCYLQVNGIHTFPDYLEGKTFFDLQN